MKYDYVVAADGSGDFLTLQDALDDSQRFIRRLSRLFRSAKVLIVPGLYQGVILRRPIKVDVYGVPGAVIGALR